jgi:transposase
VIVPEWRIVPAAHSGFSIFAGRSGLRHASLPIAYSTVTVCDFRWSGIGQPVRRVRHHRRHGDLRPAPPAPRGGVQEFLTAIDKAVPAELDVHLVCDNLATHKTPAIRDWLTKHPRFTLHFTPTGPSWINQVERWFGFLTDQLLRRGVHKSVVALENDVREWIATWNGDSRPFAWTKTAEEILATPSTNISRISGAGH